MKRRSTARTKRADPTTAAKKSDYSADKLMRSALELFSYRDFKTVTIKDIAAECGVNPALIYYYYKNKEDLFRAAIEFAINKAIEGYATLGQKDASPDAVIEKWFRNNLEMAPLIRQLVKISVDYSNSGVRIKSVDSMIKRFYRMEEVDILATSISRGVEQGIFKSCDSTAIARFVSVHLDGIMVASLIRPSLNIERCLTDLRSILFSVLFTHEHSRRMQPRRTGAATAGGRQIETIDS